MAHEAYSLPIENSSVRSCFPSVFQLRASSNLNVLAEQKSRGLIRHTSLRCVAISSIPARSSKIFVMEAVPAGTTRMFHTCVSLSAESSGSCFQRSDTSASKLFLFTVPVTALVKTCARFKRPDARKDVLRSFAYTSYLHTD